MPTENHEKFFMGIQARLTKPQRFHLYLQTHFTPPWWTTWKTWNAPDNWWLTTFQMFANGGYLSGVSLATLQLNRKLICLNWRCATTFLQVQF